MFLHQGVHLNCSAIQPPLTKILESSSFVGMPYVLLHIHHPSVRPFIDFFPLLIICRLWLLWVELLSDQDTIFWTLPGRHSVQWPFPLWYVKSSHEQKIMRLMLAIYLGFSVLSCRHVPALIWLPSGRSLQRPNTLWCCLELESVQRVECLPSEALVVSGVNGKLRSLLWILGHIKLYQTLTEFALNFLYQDLATPYAFKENPSLVWEFYHFRREVMLSKQPNAVRVLISLTTCIVID